jgi:TIGR03009 family protein
MAVCGLMVSTGICFGQANSWPNSNPIRQENAANTQNNRTDGGYQQFNPQGNPNDGRSQPGNRTADNRYGSPENRNATQPNGANQPDQPVGPRNPTLERKLPLQQPVQPPPAPFTLTPQEQAQVDAVLKKWEQMSKEIKTYECKFTLLEYDLNFPVRDPKNPNGPALPNYTDQGYLKYATPDKAIYRITFTDVKGEWVPVPPERSIYWICDGKAVWEIKSPPDALGPNDRPPPGQVIEHPLPQEMQGKAIADGPLPFLFGADADKIRNRYYLRIATPPEYKDQVWLDTYPRFQQDASNFSRAIIALNLSDMRPKSLRTYSPGGKDFRTYLFFEAVANDPLRIWKGNPFQVVIPRGWQKITEPMTDQPSQQQPGKPQAQPPQRQAVQAGGKSR